jgi:hypothetical protein
MLLQPGLPVLDPRAVASFGVGKETAGRYPVRHRSKVTLTSRKSISLPASSAPRLIGLTGVASDEFARFC